MKELQTIIEDMRTDYVRHVPYLLTIINKVGDTSTEDREDLYAALYFMVENDDGDSISVFMKNEAIYKCIQEYETELFYDEEAISAFDEKYHCGSLTPWGYAIRHNKANAISVLCEYPFYCYHNELADDWDVAIQIEDLENLNYEEIIFLIDKLGFIDVVQLCNLYIMNRESAAKRLLSALHGYDRERLMNRICEDAEPIKNDIKRTQLDLYDNTVSDMDIQETFDKVAGIIETNPDPLIRMYWEDTKRCKAYTNSWESGGIIKDIQSNDDNTTIVVVTDRECYSAAISDEEKCCEIFGGYIVCEDDVSSYIGSSLLRVSLTDMAQNTKVVEEIYSLQNAYHSCDYHNIQFINFETGKGTLQYAVYNCHNGWYGHNVTIKRNDNILFEFNI